MFMTFQKPSLSVRNTITALACALLLSTAIVSPAFAMARLTGQATQGGLLIGQVSPGSRLWLDQRPLQVTRDGSFIIGFGRDAQLRHQLKIISGDGSEQHQEILLTSRQYKVEHVNGIKPQLMHPSAEDLHRIADEKEQIITARQQTGSQSNFLETFRWPVTGRISGIYGSRRIYNGEPRRPHYGVDIAAPAGTPVRAPAGGIVRLAHPGMFFSGRTLIIDHGLGLFSSFLHLQKILVKPGDRIEQGQPIATVGASGRVTGPHLDWRINWFEQHLDPALLVPPMPTK